MKITKTHRITKLEKKVARLSANIDFLMSNLIGKKTSDVPAASGPVESKGLILSSCSAKQIATIQLVCRGVKTNEIAEILKCAESTVKVHIRGYMKKFQHKSRDEAAMHYEELVKDISAQDHKKWTKVELDWGEDPEKYLMTTNLLRTKVR
ncbi:helix-turn-helix transcriptional regulator [Paracoccaceae bacterium]|nr:helix-turn-helix transcriptional regulator [Paracoccaceae bacterium]